MKRTPLEEGSKRAGKLSTQSKASAISKQVLKSNPVPQQLINKNLDASNLLKPKAHPLRSSKVSQKLVLFPQSSTESQNMLGTLQQDQQFALPSTSSLATSHLPATGRGGVHIGYMNVDNEQQQQYAPSITTNDADFWRPQHATGVTLPTEWTFESRTDAERMPKDERDLAQLPRVAAYCTGEGYHLTRLRYFLREHHHVSPRQYDEALYAAYHFPLMTLRPDKDNHRNIRVRSASFRSTSLRRFTSDEQPTARLDSGGNNNINNSSSAAHQHPPRSSSDQQSLERSAIARQRRENDESEMNYDEDHMDQEGTPIVGSISSQTGYPFPTHHQQPQPTQHYSQENDTTVDSDRHIDEHQKILGQPTSPRVEQAQHSYDHSMVGDGNQQPIKDRPQDGYDQQQEELEHYTESHHDNKRTDEERGQQHEQPKVGTQVKSQRKPFAGGEVFVFDYGVVVFWNFRRAEELLMLEDLADYSIAPFRDNPDEDLQIEEMHFQYDTSQLKPRIFNDMITMKTGNHMIKLTLSHGLSQSAVLARYEDIMDKTIEDTKHLPKEMAETGRLGKTRAEITTINGHLFNLRMNVNLVSNVLDTPEIFWSEPALQPMYNAIREYLEIPQRAKILNDRLKVISDLLSMLRDHLTNFGVEYQTLIIIYLIIIAVIVACFEIAVKILQSIKL